MPKFKPGDIVTSGDEAPNMEVIAYLKVSDKKSEYKTGIPDVHSNNLTCKWFDGKKFHLETFDEDELVLVKRGK